MLFSLLFSYAFGDSNDGISLHTRSNVNLFNLACTVCTEFGLTITLRKTNILVQDVSRAPCIFISDHIGCGGNQDDSIQSLCAEYTALWKRVLDTVLLPRMRAKHFPHVLFPMDPGYYMSWLHAQQILPGTSGHTKHVCLAHSEGTCKCDMKAGSIDPAGWKAFAENQSRWREAVGKKHGQEAKWGSMRGKEKPRTPMADEWIYGVTLIVSQDRRRPMNGVTQTQWVKLIELLLSNFIWRNVKIIIFKSKLTTTITFFILC